MARLSGSSPPARDPAAIRGGNHHHDAVPGRTVRLPRSDRVLHDETGTRRLRQDAGHGARQRRLTSNTIHPGAVAGERIDRVLQGRADASGLSLDEVRRQAMVNESIQEFIDPADIAALVLFLAGPHARTISGQLFPIDGDSNPPSDPSRVSPDRQAAPGSGRLCREVEQMGRRTGPRTEIHR
jgi:hypothetical protein